jgi:hypothetical protein
LVAATKEDLDSKIAAQNITAGAADLLHGCLLDLKPLAGFAV